MEAIAENFKLIYISHENTPLETREKLMLNEIQAKNLMGLMKDQCEIQEALILSTCNRTEVYYNHPQDLTIAIRKLVKTVLINTNAPVEQFDSINDHEETIARLFEVSIGLLSQVIGDMQIINQVKKAYQWSADTEMAGPILHRAMHTIFFTNKRVVQETPFRDGAASISYAAKELADDIATQLKNPKILILGTGEIGRDLCGNFEDSKHSISVSNRTSSSAIEMAESYGYNYLPFQEVNQYANSEADIIISSVSMSKPFFDKDYFSTLSGHKHRYLIDLSVPRSVDPTLSESPDFIVYNLDELESKASETLEKRLKSLDTVQEIVIEELANFHDWSREMIVSPTIKRLKKALESIRTEELSRYLKNSSSSEQQLVDKVTKSMMQKILKLPVLELKAACKRGEAETLIDVLNDLFDLEKQEEKA